MLGDEVLVVAGDPPDGASESQETKLAVLAVVLDLSGPRVLDVGCGLGQYADHLERRFDGVSYTGIDLSPGMIATALERRSELEVSVGNVPEAWFDRPFDLVNANGIFYLLADRAPALMRKVIERMWSLTASGRAAEPYAVWTATGSGSSRVIPSRASVSWTSSRALKIRHFTVASVISSESAISL